MRIVLQSWWRDRHDDRALVVGVDKPNDGDILFRIPPSNATYRLPRDKFLKRFRLEDQ